MFNVKIAELKHFFWFLRTETRIIVIINYQANPHTGSQVKQNAKQMQVDCSISLKLKGPAQENLTARKKKKLLTFKSGKWVFDIAIVYGQVA